MQSFEKIVVLCLLVIMGCMLYATLQIKKGVEEIEKGVRVVKDKADGTWVQDTVGDVVDTVRGALAAQN